MIYQALIRKPQEFKNLTGLSVSEFDELLQKVTLVWQQQQYQRLSRPDRQRAIGAGGEYKLELQDRLLMTLVWLHLCLTTEALGSLFGVDKSTVSRNTRNVLSALRQVSEASPEWGEPPRRRRGKSLDQILHEYPDLSILANSSSPNPPAG
jgi:hypothetical protein